METVVAKKIATAVKLTRKVWAYSMVAVILYVAFTQPWWCLLFLPPLAVITYFGMITLTAMWLSTQITVEENDIDNQARAMKKIHEELQSGELEPGSEEMFKRMHEAGLTEIVPLGEFSKEIVGTYDGQPIHEWVEVQHAGAMSRFYYHSPASFSEGSPVMPDDEGKIFACVNGIVYAKDK